MGSGALFFLSLVLCRTLFFQRNDMRKEIISFHSLLLGVVKKSFAYIFSLTLEKAPIRFCA